MWTVQRVITPLRLLLVLLFGLLVVAEVMMVPGQLGYWTPDTADDGGLRWPLLVVWEIWLVCVQVVVVCTWQLLSHVRSDRIFTESSLPWVDGILAAMGVGWVVLLGVCIRVAFVADDPGGPMLLLIFMVVSTALILLMGVMRELLRQATTLRNDMEGVI